MLNPYQVLGVSPLDSMEDIKKVYRRLCKEYHPDMSNGDVDKFREVNEAWEFINTHSKPEEKNGYWSHKTLFTVERRS